MKYISCLIIVSTILFIGRPIEIALNGPETCLDYLVESADTTKMFYFNYNHNIDNVNMVLYHKGVRQVWHETGYGIEYKTSLQVQYKEAGTYTMCFMKSSEGVADVSFEIVDEDDMSQFAGKEQLAKLSKRISQFLMDIKRVGWTFKRILEQHNSRKETIAQQQHGYGYLLVLKTVVMIVIVGVQVLIVKRIFK